MVIQGVRPKMPSNASALGISDGLWRLLVRCWDADRTKRPPINEVLQHLSQEDVLRVVFPPSKLPQALSCDSVLESMTHRYGSSSYFSVTSSCAYSSVADVFHTAARTDPPTEGNLVLGPPLFADPLPRQNTHLSRCL